MKCNILLIAAFFILPLSMYSQQIVQIWPNAAPNDLGLELEEMERRENITLISKVVRPTIEVYRPSPQQATGQAVVICPGGGYGVLAYDWEGTDIAKWLNSHGITGIVLKYRLPLHEHQSEAHYTPLMDAQRAMRLTRAHAEEWGIDPNRVGVMGFSAGGHLASSLSVHYDRIVYQAIDEIDEVSAKPDFSILLYPVISLKSEVTHIGSRNNLLGPHNDDQQLIGLFSNELHVNHMTPPTILIHSSDDLAVPVKNSIDYYEALVKSGIAAEMHIYPYGGHGYSLAINKGRLSRWPDRVVEWLQALDKK